MKKALVLALTFLAVTANAAPISDAGLSLEFSILAPSVVILSVPAGVSFGTSDLVRYSVDALAKTMAPKTAWTVVGIQKSDEKSEVPLYHVKVKAKDRDMTMTLRVPEANLGGLAPGVDVTANTTVRAKGSLIYFERDSKIFATLVDPETGAFDSHRKD